MPPRARVVHSTLLQEEPTVGRCNSQRDTMPLLSGNSRSSCSRRSSRSGGFTLRQPPVVDVGCNCRKPRLLRSLLSSLTPGRRGAKPKSPHASSSSTTAFTSSTAGATTVSSADSWAPATYATLYEDELEARRQERRRRRSSRRRRQRSGQAVAVEVESAAPYEDFRESMVAMVVEKEMYAWEDLNALLHGFLSLNSPRHHPLILHAFADLWTNRGGPFCPPSPFE